jgi:hypothetical protein
MTFPLRLLKNTRAIVGWTWAALMVGFLGFTVLAPAFSRTSSSPELTIQRREGALLINWSRDANRRAASIEIVDGGMVTTIPIGPDLSSATYQPRTGDVQVLLCTEKTRFLGPAPTDLEATANKLTAEAAVHQRQIDKLGQTIAKLYWARMAAAGTTAH